MKILIMGLPGSGKTTLAKQLRKDLTHQHKKLVLWFNADKIRQEYNDWDFTPTGRLRQATRMNELAKCSDSDYVICDFVCPTHTLRNIFNADYTIWVDTIDAGRFDDTNKLFVPPDIYDVKVTEQAAEKWSTIIINTLLKYETKI